MSFAENLLFKFTDFFLKSQNDVELHGPLFMNVPEHKNLIARMIEFRSKQNIERAPWLETPEQLELENRLQLDLRSAHFVATQGGQVVVCLRLTEGPFELSLLNPSLNVKDKSHSGYFEFSRLCTLIGLKNRGLIARLLCIKAGLWIFSKTEAAGIIAVCQVDKQNYMAKFSLYAEGETFEIPGRNGKYCFISSPREKVLMRFMKEFLGMGEKRIDENVSQVS